MELSLSSFLLYFSFSSLLLKLSAQTDNAALPGTIKRVVKQQVLAAIPPGEPAALPPFLTSPTGKYAASFLRTPTAPGAGGFGNDFCYIEVTETATGESVWESECTPASTSNTCSLVFSDDGLEIFDGSNSVWNSDAQSSGGNPLQSLELVDEGDMRIRDKEGELAWKASEDPRSNQRCGEVGSPGLAAVVPPFAQPAGGDGGMVFGQQAGGGGQIGAAGGGSGGSRNVREVGWVVLLCFMTF